MGSRRAATAAASSRSRLALVVDSAKEAAARLANEAGTDYMTDWRAAVNHPDIDAVVVSTFNRELAPITVAALRSGKHVLCEKPPGRNAVEANAMAEAARSSGKTLKIGFTLRFHPAIEHAKRACDSGAIGPIFFLRAVYGHGGRPGYAKEWRGNRELAGGGELLDQGVHLLDLTRLFLGKCSPIAAVTRRWFWEIAPLEDNAFLTIGTADHQIAHLHTSWTQWRNRFTLELYGRDGYLGIHGLGGSYGTETCVLGRRQHDSSAPTEERVTFEGPDPSWQADWDDFVKSIDERRPPAVDGDAGVEIMEMVDRIYDLAKAVEVSRP